MSWALWLAAPLVATALAAIALWLRGRPARVAPTDDAINAHQAYLDALTVPARGRIRVDRH
ncbi:MAG: hypothetical protein QOE97_1972 [Pseudonocardiales bacterium]|jgi:hypothetical protein|nr:hypothetical protein [Pseudonocardiales bacterium]